jgi:hypothetical protein
MDQLGAVDARHGISHFACYQWLVCLEFDYCYLLAHIKGPRLFNCDARRVLLLRSDRRDGQIMTDFSADEVWSEQMDFLKSKRSISNPQV